MRTYLEILDIIENSRRFESRPGVEVSALFLDKLNKPQQNIPFIHVAGTNGKGSVCAFLTSICKEAGIKVGTFTSPHLMNFEERIRVNGEMISKDNVTRLGDYLIDQAKSLIEIGCTPTMFDYCLAMAILYFKECQCDLMILETGLGGRLDSTNAVGVPVASAITTIGYDHVDILGNDLVTIAWEKAGIIKHGTKLVVQKQADDVVSVFTEAADKAGLKEVHVVDDNDLRITGELNLKMLGEYQSQNAAVAMGVARYLDIDDTVIKKGLELAIWPGRMEVLSLDPFLLIDGAHNSNGVEALANSLMKMYPGEKFHFIMAVMADKDYQVMIEKILPIAHDFVTVTPDSSRALQAKDLAEFINQKGIGAKESDNIESALKEIKSRDKKEKTVAFGSLYFIGELERIACMNFFNG